MNTKPTPGPWEYANDEVFAEPTNESVCVILQKLPHAEANARPIAAAPELLAAAKHLDDVANEPNGHHEGWEAAMTAASNRLRDALAKAERKTE